MSSVRVDNPVAAEADRSALATHRLCDSLGLGVPKPNELKQLGTALAEAATQEVAAHPAFAERILAIFRELTEKPKPATAAAAGEPSRRKRN
jgi:hypothetical protein